MKRAPGEPRSEVAILRALVKAQWRVIESLYAGRDPQVAERKADHLYQELELRHSWDQCDRDGAGIDAVASARWRRHLRIEVKP